MNFDITEIIGAVISLLCIIITTVVVPYYKAKTTREQRDSVAFWVKLAVEAAEQIFRGSGMGVEKKAYVIKYLSDHGIALDEQQLDVMIESAVLQMKNALAE